MTERIRQFLLGRSGFDQLSYAMLLLGWLLSFLGRLFLPLRLVGIVLLVLSVLRALSRKVDKRRDENEKFRRLAGPALDWLRLRRTMLRDKDHRYFKCPNCGQQLRVPRGKGRITITCRSCGASFEEKS